MTSVHGPSLGCREPFPSPGSGPNENDARSAVFGQDSVNVTLLVPKSPAYNAATGRKQGVTDEQTRTPHFGRRGEGVPGGRRADVEALPHPEAGPFRRQRRQSGEEQGFLLQAARLPHLRPNRFRAAAAGGPARGRRNDRRLLLAPRHGSPFVRVFSEGRLRGSQPAFAEALGNAEPDHLAGGVAAGSVG